MTATLVSLETENNAQVSFTVFVRILAPSNKQKGIYINGLYKEPLALFLIHTSHAFFFQTEQLLFGVRA